MRLPYSSINLHNNTDAAYSAILSIMAKNPEKVFVKGGLFPKHGIEIPPPALELFMKRSESWEVVHENANVLMEQ